MWVDSIDRLMMGHREIMLHGSGNSFIQSEVSRLFDSKTNTIKTTKEKAEMTTRNVYILLSTIFIPRDPVQATTVRSPHSPFRPIHPNRKYGLVSLSQDEYACAVRSCHASPMQTTCSDKIRSEPKDT